MKDHLTIQEAFESMRVFLEWFNEREPEGRQETLFHLLDWTTLEADGGTADPAQWDDWLRAVETVRSRGDAGI